MKSSLLTPALPLFLALICTSGAAQAASDDKPVLVTPDNFVRAESDLYFSGVVKDGGFGKFMHRREPTPIAKQTVIRMNRDTLYSAAVFDLDAGPVTITVPDPGKRFLSMQVIDEDEYTPEVHYGAAVRTLTKDQIGTRYAIVAVRILVDPDDPRTSGRSTRCRMRSRSASPAGPGPSRSPIGMHRARLKSGTRYSASARRSLTPKACSVREGTSTLCVT